MVSVTQIRFKMISGLHNLYFFVQDVPKRLKMPVLYYISTFKSFVISQKCIISKIFSRSHYNCPKIFGQNGPNFRFQLKNSRSIKLKVYPRGQIAKIHQHFNTVDPLPHSCRMCFSLNYNRNIQLTISANTSF